MTEQAPAYTVISTQDTMAYDAAKGMIRHKRVNVRFADGTQTYVEVPYGPDWSQQAQQLIEEHYGQHQDIMSVQGPPVAVTQPPTRQLRPGG